MITMFPISTVSSRPRLATSVVAVTAVLVIAAGALWHQAPAVAHTQRHTQRPVDNQAQPAVQPATPTTTPTTTLPSADTSVPDASMVFAGQPDTAPAPPAPTF